ncbi:MAG: ThuA domain-containing protein [Planctomycetota bacterium]|nr:ThuA domain-containing protein [Planctomycetaceae bacterium]MDQ3329876.1 ThuA domain-containing protein [Planctomycetota bacterium]
MVARILLLFVTGLFTATASAAEKPLRVLFLGDNGHHRPADRAAQLTPVLSGRGIDVTYTEDMRSLDDGFLSKFDALLLYANTERIEPQQEAALLSYVENGGGFVPVHCASFCFQNSPKFIALVGGQFKSHGMGDFETKIVAPEHPIMEGFLPFATWDETYVHTKHNTENRTVLQVRAEGNDEEPWTWVRSQGKGRVFYTAYGHDERTWMQPGFQALIERGIRWAANKGEVFDGTERPREGLKPFEYAEALLPNYVPSNKWGTLGEPIRTMQLPVEPEESQKHLVVPESFTPKPYAAEPDIAKPIAMAWDERGRLWIAETFDYPNDLQPAGQGNDRIKICEDTNGDGKADAFTIFAEKLSIPTSLAFAYGGIIVHQAPDTLFLKDTDGDGKADVREALFTGWGTRDTHAGPSNLRYGLDGWYYGIVGYAGFRGTVAGEEHEFRQGFYRFQLERSKSKDSAPTVSNLEFLRSTNNNSWGVGFSEEGLLFGSTANGCPSVFVAIPNRYYEAVRGWSPSVLPSISPSNRFFPITEKVRQVDHHGGFTSAAGHALYTARAYPEQYWNKTAFVSDPTGHLTATFVLKPKGSDFVAYNSWNLVASDDEWTAPIVAEVGPDGHMWVIDWYNYVVQHNPTPAGFETGKGAAHVTPLRDKRHGRIYRIEYDAAKTTEAAPLNPQNTDGLVEALGRDNLTWRLHAQRLLIENGNKDVASKLLKAIAGSKQDATGLNAVATHALWTLNALGALDTNDDARAAVTALKNDSAAARRAAVLVLPRDEGGAKTLLDAGILEDGEPQVRLAALLALAEMPVSDEVANGVATALIDSGVSNDRWLTDAATAAAASHSGPFLISMAKQKNLSQEAIAVVGRVAEHYARAGKTNDAVRVLTAVAENLPVAEAALEGFAEGWPGNTTVKLDAATEEALVNLFGRLSAQGQGRLVRLASIWGNERFEKYASELAEGFRKTAADAKKPDEERIAAARQLIEFRKSDAKAAESILKLVTPQVSPELAAGLVSAISLSDAEDAGPAIIERWGSATPSAREAAVRVLLSRPAWTQALMNGIESGELQLSDLSLDQRQGLANHPSRRIAERARALLAKGGGLPSADRQKVIEELSPLVLEGGDVAKGKLVFTQQCAKCHKHSGEGTEIGPDLTGMATHPREELLIHILDPSRSVEGNFRQYTAVTTDGLVLNGLLASETKASVEIVDSEGKRHQVLREEIEELAVSPKSVMPEGFEKQVPPEAIADLLAFMTQRGKYVPLDLRKAATVASDEGMFTNKQADAERLIFSDWSPKTVEGVPFYLVDPQAGRVPNAILLYSPNGQFPPRMPKSVRLPVRSSAAAIHLLSGVAGWAHPFGEDGTVSMIVRLHYADGSTEGHELLNGVHFADYIRVVDVPESKLAFRLRGQQIRALAVRPQKNAEIAEVEFEKGPDETAPVVMAVTIETVGSRSAANP